MPQIYRGEDHDSAIRKIAENIARHNPGKYRIVIGSDESATVNANSGFAPDILLFEGDSATPTLSIEVETATTVTSEQALQRWKPLAQASPLEIVLPKDLVPRARSLCHKHGIKAKLIQY